MHTVVSLFSGCGGLDLGFQGNFSVFNRHYPALPFEIVAAYDNFSDAVETYKLNLGNEIACLDLSQKPTEDIPAADILIGGFPCQDFSSSGPKVGLSGERGQLYTALTHYMERYRPKIVIGENVPYLARLDRGKHLEHILNEYESVGYSFEVWELYCPDYGLPQSRRRLFLVGVRNDLPGFPRKPLPTHSAAYYTIDQALADLEPITDETITNQSQYFVASRATAGGGQGDHKNRRGDVAYCIRANARGRIQFHYELDRRLTVRECARLQSFPDDYVFPYSTQRNLTLIGNAVPPMVAHQVASSISRYLSEISEKQPTKNPEKLRRPRLPKQLGLSF
ncbi:DNA cytosine methyltransferase [Jiella marina]|uniref:DNA cytosine methyltransferase n=1 Tax=Jiella sp. LLJ827 TaxID=2917712 RepID=UPI0021014A0D|nr:DNA (cytosine-5-)-methyltransferase [Jiella sp. LLJ827]MCQ0990591.1 DNA cytosine methyltransferase [Jiella sp. LLJ827]